MTVRKLTQAERKATVKRETRETTISVTVNLDGTGKDEMCTGIRLFDHMLSQIARHGVFDIKVSATGDDVHHLVEDVGICLGKAFNEALGDKKGLVRTADATVPHGRSAGGLWSSTSRRPRLLRFEYDI